MCVSTWHTAPLLPTDSAVPGAAVIPEQGCAVGRGAVCLRGASPRPAGQNLDKDYCRLPFLVAACPISVWVSHFFFFLWLKLKKSGKEPKVGAEVLLKNVSQKTKVGCELLEWKQPVVPLFLPPKNLFFNHPRFVSAPHPLAGKRPFTTWFVTLEMNPSQWRSVPLLIHPWQLQSPPSFNCVLLANARLWVLPELGDILCSTHILLFHIWNNPHTKCWNLQFQFE